MPERLLVACHDAGGAEMVLGWLRRHGPEWREVRFVLDGPARRLFRDRLGPPAHTTYDVAPADFDMVLCGSGSRLEREAVLNARRAGAFCVTYLDHWKNYAARFDLLPDEVWVTDRYAADLAEEELPGAKVKVKGNAYLEATLEEIAAIKAPQRRRCDRLQRVLFIHEPGRSREFRQWVRHGFSRGQTLRERPHPSMAIAERTLAEDLVWADTVVGCDSMALAVALRAKREVISVLPRREKLHIPFPGIERMYLP